MAELTAEIVDQVVSACKAGADEAAGAFSRALGVSVRCSVAEPGSLADEQPPEGIPGPGLAIVLVCGDAGALLLLPESCGLVPAWCMDPDPTGQSKLTTLAQELGMLVLPEEFLPEDFGAAWVPSLAEALHRGGVPDGAACVPLQLAADQQEGVASLVWPASRPLAALDSGGNQPLSPPETEPPAESQPAAEPEGTGQIGAAPGVRANSLGELPNYSRSLLRIKVPVVVTLAEQRQPLARIVDLGPGSIIQFDKSCEEMLELDVGGHPVATGEAVKVGDKFGLRITSMILPEERFWPVRPSKT